MLPIGFSGCEMKPSFRLKEKGLGLNVRQVTINYLMLSILFSVSVSSSLLSLYCTLFSPLHHGSSLWRKNRVQGHAMPIIWASWGAHCKSKCVHESSQQRPGQAKEQGPSPGAKDPSP